SNWRRVSFLWPDGAEKRGSRLGRAVPSTYESGVRSARRVGGMRVACAARGCGPACLRSYVDEAASLTAPLQDEARDSAQPHAPAIEAVRKRATSCQLRAAVSLPLNWSDRMVTDESFSPMRIIERPCSIHSPRLLLLTLSASMLTLIDRCSTSWMRTHAP